MEIARIEVGRTTGVCTRRERIPAGIVGASVQVSFTDPVWDNLIKTVVFRGKETRIAEFDGAVAEIPHEVIPEPRIALYFGIFGHDPDTDLQIPLIEVYLGTTEKSTDANADPGADPTLPIWAQLQQDVEQLKQNGGIPGPPGEPGPEGEDGEDGGYYTPDVTQLDEDTIQFTFTPSKPDMPAANPVTVELPSGQGSGGNVEDGFSPIATVEQTATGAVISITDKTGTTTATITNGKDGKDGADGQPGEKGDKGDPGAQGEPGKDGANGKDGSPGTPGADGITPHVGSNGNWFIGDNDTGIPATGPAGGQGLPGTPGEDGKDGTSATHSWNGTVLTITSASGTSSADLKGAKGDKGDKGDTGATGSPGTDGHTPVKNVDYFDGKDGKDGKDGTIQNVPLFAESVDWLNENGDPTKVYVLPDGFIYAYMLTETEVEGYKNWIPYSTVSGGGSIYNGTGYKIGYRMNSSGQEKELTDSIVFGFIPVTKNSVLRIKNFSNNDLPRLQHSANYIHLYNSSYTLLTTSQQGSGSFVMRNNCMDETTGICTVKLSDILDNDDIAFVRVSSLATINGGTATEEDAAKFIITVDQEITENSGSTAIEYIWTNTGHAFVPADYEDRIIDVEKTAGDNAARIKVLEASADTEANVPEYWMSHLEEKAKQIQIAMEDAGRNKSAFLWYTDAHWVNGNSKMSPMLLKYLYKNTPMNKVNFGGDIIGDSLLNTRDAMGYLYEWRRMIKDLPNHHSVLGNHDNFRSDNVDYEDDNFVYSFLIAPEESADMVMGGDFYYYIDNPCEKTRYLYLDSGRYSLSDGETAFVIDALKNTPSGWHIVVISHIWFQYSAVATPTVGNMNGSMQKLLNLFDAYNSRQSGSVTMASVAKSYDFTNCGGKVEFCIGGHIHVDYDLESAGGIPVIITTADANQNRVPDSEVDSGTIGTITESAVFGIIADYNSNKITVVGVGRGTDRLISY